MKNTIPGVFKKNVRSGYVAGPSSPPGNYFGVTVLNYKLEVTG